MSFFHYIEDKIFYILAQFFLIVFLTIFLYIMDINFYSILLVVLLLLFLLISYFLGDYLFLKKRNQKIISLVDGLEEKYYISEILPKSNSIESIAYLYALKLACKSMNDKIGKLEQEKQDYQEYIESFVHEIKTPISALFLALDDNKNSILKKEVDKINLLVEQILFFARSSTTEKDYFIKKINLSDLVHQVILKYKDYLLGSKIVLDIHDLDKTIYTDEKWLIFVLSQVLQNSIKYLDKDKKKIKIFSEDWKNSVILILKDNGCGIKESDLIRVFEKGFTGSDRTKSKSTEMGLYLAKKICDNLGLKMEITSNYKEETTVKIIIPKSTFHPL